MASRKPADGAENGLADAIQISVARLRTPVGALEVIAALDRVLYIRLPGLPPTRFRKRLPEYLRSDERTPALFAALTQLREYFAGTRRSFDVHVAPVGTEFQRAVWRALLAIPFGQTRTYGDIAAELGDPQLARAVGAASGANPIPIIVPCHRVIGADGSMIGYGGGLKMKTWLLRHEGVLLA